VSATRSWATGRFRGGGSAQLLFGRMYEDAAVELDALRECRAVLAIASAGDTAMALAAAGHAVTAVDVNPVQIDYLRWRMAGGPPVPGRAERVLDRGRRALAVTGWTPRRLQRLSRMTDCAEQVRMWRSLTTGLSGLALKALLAPGALRTAYRPEFAEIAAPLADELPGRIERGLARHPNHDNPWAQALFVGRWPAEGEHTWAAAINDPSAVASAPPTQIRAVVADVVDHLEQAGPGRYDGFALSNILDGAPAAYARRLTGALARLAHPEAVVVLRTLGRGCGLGSGGGADPAQDRSLIWGGLTIATVEELACMCATA